jgi:periodic tryptophan protein 1
VWDGLLILSVDAEESEEDGDEDEDAEDADGDVDMDQDNKKPDDPNDLSAFKMEDYDNEESTGVGRSLVPLLTVMHDTD